MIKKWLIKLLAPEIKKQIDAALPRETKILIANFVEERRRVTQKANKSADTLMAAMGLKP